MSQYDEYYYVDPEPVVEKLKVEVPITTLTYDQINDFIVGMKICLKNKLDKLNLILKQIRVFRVDDCLLLNDRYSVFTDLKEIVSNFGMDVNTVEVSELKGKCYLINDKITAILKALGETYTWCDIKNIESSTGLSLSSIKTIKYPNISNTYTKEILSLIKEIKETGRVTTSGIETLIDGVSQGVSSNKIEIENKLKKLLSDIKQEAIDNNKNVQNGTAEMLYQRAKSLGYDVEKKVDNGQIQLVLTKDM